MPVSKLLVMSAPSLVSMVGFPFLCALLPGNDVFLRMTTGCDTCCPLGDQHRGIIAFTTKGFKQF